MSMWMWWLIGGGGVLAVLVTGAQIGGTQRRRAREYARHPGEEGHARHVAGAAVGYGYVLDDPVPDFYGSAILAEERALYWPAAARWEARHEDGPGWREQTAADLSPEALDGQPELFACIYCGRDTPNGAPCPVCGWDRCADCGRCVDQAAHDLDSGPGVVPSAFLPGPEWGGVPESTHRPVLVASAPARTAPPTDLGPRAAWVLDCYERRRREKWAWAVAAA